MTGRTPAPHQGRWAAAGAVVAASAASACCWLPMLLLGLGASAAGVSAQLERFRPLLLGVTTVLLGAGFVLNYARKPTCAPGEACATANRRMRRVNRLVLWLATIAVAAFAAFPHYAGSLGGTRSALTEEWAELPRIELSLYGMTCEACAAHVARELLAVPRVRGVAVDYENARASVAFDPEAAPSPDELVRAVEQVGYTANLLRSAPPP